MSVSLQLVANEGDPEGLFRGAIMQSGAPLPIGDVTLGQKHYDDLVLRTSCLHTDDTLDCLRRTPYETLRTAIEASMGIFDYTVGALATQNMAHLDLPFIVVHGPFVDTSTGRCLHSKLTGGYDPRRAGSQSSCHQW
jgi:hypothetical protein